jgi:hypothetical protein
MKRMTNQHCTRSGFVNFIYAMHGNIKALLPILVTGLVMFSCNVSSNLEDIQPSSQKASQESIIGGPVFSFPISFNRVDIITTTSDAISGTITMEIRNADGSAVLGSTTVLANNLVKGHMKRNSFYFALTLNSGQKYRIYLTRSGTHNASTDYFAWRTSSGGTNPYPNGVPSVYPGWSLDFSFVTFSDGYVDQQQLSANYGFSIYNNGYRWQEFVPQKIWVVEP